jgi:hypothetical protein
MAVNKRKTVVIYTVLVVVVGISVVIGLFASGSLKIGADFDSAKDTNITGQLTSGKWNLVGNPCGGTGHIQGSDGAFGGAYKYAVATNRNFQQGYAYWVRPDDGHKPMWLVNAVCDNANVTEKAVKVTVGEVTAIGNPFYSAIPWGDIKVTAGSETLTLKEALDKKWVMLAFYNNKDKNYADANNSDSLNAAYQMVDVSATLTAARGVIGESLKPLQGFYIAAAPKLGKDTAVTVTFKVVSATTQ